VEGGTAELVSAIKAGAWRAVPRLSERERALCTVAEKLSATPTRMVEEDWQPLRDIGFDDEACLEVGHVVGIFNYLTRLADGFGLQLDAGTKEASETGMALQRPEGGTHG
jgi:uncharacterized peroxidase-related enzyme